jgi:hypothetical protein
MSVLIAIDPGPTESAWVLWDGARLESFAKKPNQAVIDRVRQSSGDTFACVIEQVASYGMPVGAEVFDTVYWSGRFAEAYGAERVHRVPRLAVKLHLCHDSRAKDGNIRQALIDRFGGKEKALGKKSSPGPLYGVSGDVWAALALCITWWDLNTSMVDTRLT